MGNSKAKIGTPIPIIISLTFLQESKGIFTVILDSLFFIVITSQSLLNWLFLYKQFSTNSHQVTPPDYYYSMVNKIHFVFKFVFTS